MTDWKPGQVGLSRGSERFIVTSDGKCFWPGSDDARWSGISGNPVAEDRPLVVIDPENPEDVERLAKALANSGAHRGRVAASAERNAIANALREFAAPSPPKCDDEFRVGGSRGIHCELAHDHTEWHRSNSSEVSWS